MALVGQLPLENTMFMRRAMGLSLLAGLVITASCTRVAKEPEKVQDPEVVVDHPTIEVLPETLVVTGRLEAVLTVDIRSRVTGYLEKVYFKDGAFVKKDDLLYLIDPRPYQAKLDVSKGEVERLDGERKLAEIQVDRYKKLSEKGAASKQEYDVWIGKRDENIGAMAAAKAQVVYNQLNLDFCKVTSPIDGQISRTFLQVGNLINADTTSLTNMVSIDPIYVYVNIDEPTLIRVLKELRAGQRETYNHETYILDVGLADDLERKFPFKGKMNFVNNQLDKQTGTITIRGEIANPYDPTSKPPKMPLLRPGMFARVKLPLSKPLPRVMVPEVAIANNQDRKVVWVVDSENKARMIEVEPGQKEGSKIAVRSLDEKKPLNQDSLIVVKGIQRCRENQGVKPVKAEDGKLNPGQAKGIDPKGDAKSAPSATSEKKSSAGLEGTGAGKAEGTTPGKASSTPPTETKVSSSPPVESKQGKTGAAPKNP